MNGRTLSRAIQSSRPMTIAATMRTATRGESGTNRDLPGRPPDRRTAAAGARLPSEPGRSRERRRSVGRAPPWCRRLPDVDARSETAPGPPAEAPARRGPASAAPALAPRAGTVRGRARARGPRADRAWETALEASALPLFRPVGRVRGRIAFGAPLPADARGRARAGRHPPDRVRPDLAGARGPGRPPARRLAAGRPLRRLARQPGPRRAGRRGRLPDRGDRRGRRRRSPTAAAGLLAADAAAARTAEGRLDRPLRPAAAAGRRRRRRRRARRSCFEPGPASTPCSGPAGPRRSSRRSATRSAPRSSSPRSSANG